MEQTYMDRTSSPSTIERIDVATFEEMARAPENLDRNLELVAGEIVEMVSNQRSAGIASILLVELGGYVRRNQLGFTTGADGGYAFGDERYIPDIAYVPFERQSELGTEAYATTPPALVIEVLSPSNQRELTTMRRKIHTYTVFGAVVWIVDPDTESIEVYVPGEQLLILGVGDTLSGKPALPEFSIAVKEIFSVRIP
jgi:Uma2 family endonuclease